MSDVMNEYFRIMAPTLTKTAAGIDSKEYDEKLRQQTERDVFKATHQSAEIISDGIYKLYDTIKGYSKYMPEELEVELEQLGDTLQSVSKKLESIISIKTAAKKEDKKHKQETDPILEKAHPKPAYIAESRGDGGLVENLVELHDKLMAIVNKMPTGSLVGRYASAINTITKYAAELDNLDEPELADTLMDLSNKMFEELSNFSTQTKKLDQAADKTIEILEQ